VRRVALKPRKARPLVRINDTVKNHRYSHFFQEITSLMSVRPERVAPSRIRGMLIA